MLLDFDNVSTTIFEIGDLYAKLAAESTQFINTHQYEKNFKLCEYFVTMNNMFVDWGYYFFNKT